MNKDCGRAEILAGAIALGEASDGERDEYRRHIASCASCLETYGGEREIERVMSTVAQARESEIWEPVAVVATQRRARRLLPFFGLGASAVALGVAISVGAHALVAASIRPATLAAAPASAQNAQVFHVSLDRPATPVQTGKPASAPPRMVIVHNVITLKRTTTNASHAAVRTGETTVVAEAAPAAVEPTAHPIATAAPAPSNVPIWRRGGLPQAARGAVARPLHDTPPILAGRAESIAVAPSYVVRDAMPVGGETALNPQPPPIAYAQGAEGTTAFEVTIDDRGAAVKCTITKSSGYLSLDGAVCKAAMHAKYTPKTVNGRPTVGVYRDAFTFRADNDSDAQI